MRVDGARVWVVGASSGIGAALARELVWRGARVAVSARRRDALEQVAAGLMAVEPVDVTSRAAVRAAAAACPRPAGRSRCRREQLRRMAADGPA